MQVMTHLSTFFHTDFNCSRAVEFPAMDKAYLFLRVLSVFFIILTQILSEFVCHAQISRIADFRSVEG